MFLEKKMILFKLNLDKVKKMLILRSIYLTILKHIIMKKIIFVLMTVAATFTFVACSSDDDKGPNCEQLAQNLLNAVEAYMEDQSEANEQAMSAASEALERAGCEDMDIEIE